MAPKPQSNWYSPSFPKQKMPQESAHGVPICFPWAPRGQVDCSSATAELWDNPEEEDIEVAHQDVDLVLHANTITPIPKAF